MKKIQFYCLLICALFLAQFAQAQTANFTEGCSPLEVQFTGPSGLSDYFWDFGNNGTSSLQNPSRVFNSPGAYEVTLRESVGGTLVGTLNIMVYAQPQLAITGDPQAGCSPVSTQFSNTSVLDPAVNFTTQWSFGALGTSTESSPVFTFLETGNYNIALSIESDLPNCSATEQFPNFIQVTDAPEVSFTTTPSPAADCVAPLEVDFNITSDPNLTYVWDFGNGMTFEGINPPTQSYDNNGTFLVSLTGTDGVACAVTRTTTVSIGPPDVTFNSSDVICAGSATSFQNLSPNGTYTWDFGDGNMSSDTNPEHTYTTAGMYDVTLTVETAQGCINSSMQTIEVGLVDATFTADPIYTCDGEIIVTYTPNTLGQDSYEWMVGDSTISTEEIVIDTIYGYDTMIYSVNMLMTYEATLTVTSDDGCSATEMETITVDRPNAEFIVDTISGCAPLEVVFSDSSFSNTVLVEWLYDLGNGETVSNTTGDDIAYTFTEAGEYDVVLITTTELGCKDTSYAIQILVGAEIEDLNFSADQTTICVGDTINFEGISGSPNIDAWHFNTDGGRSFHCFQDPNMAWIFNSEVGTMDVSLTAEYNGCLSSELKTDFITVNGPLAKLAYEIECETPYTVMFRDSSMEATSVLWEFGDGMTSDMADPTHVYANTGDYKVVLTVMNDATGCPASKDSTVVCIRDINASFELDTLICQGQVYLLDGTPSENVDQRCWRGFTWHIPNQNRPITTNEDAIEFIFGTPGPDVVNLYTRDINGCLDTMSLDVTVYSVTPNFTFDPAPICYPAEVNFTDQSVADTIIDTWSWDFGDGGMDEGPMVSHTFTNPPASVTLTVVDILGCEGSNTMSIPDYQPFSNISPVNPIICEGATVDFSATDFTQQGSNLTFDWDFGNGMTSTNQTESVTYTIPGTYEVSLNYEEISTGCSGSTTTTVEVQAIPQVDFTSNIDDVDPICSPVIVSFTNQTETSSPTNYMWDLGDGQTSMNQNAGNNYAAGTYTVSLTATTFPAGCAATDEMTFTALDGPDGNFTIDVGTICNGENVMFTLTDTSNVSTFTWDFGDGSTETDTNPITHTYNLPQGQGQVTANLVLTSLDGLCETSIPKTFTVVDANAAFEAIVACDGTVAFTNNSSGSDTYEWNFGDGGDVSNETSPIHAFAAGTYTVTLTVTDAGSGCTDMTSQEVTVDEPVIAAFTGGETISCDGEFTFNSDGSFNANAYDWNFGDIGTSNEENPTFTFPGAGVYNVELTVTSASGCANTTSSVVNVAVTSAAFSANLVDPCAGAVIFNNESSEATNYTWDFGDGNTSILEFPETHIYTSIGDFTVSLTATNNATGCTSTTSQVITISNLEPIVADFIVSEDCGMITLVNNSSTGADTFEWNFGDGNESTDTAPTHSYNNIGEYTIQLTASNGACLGIAQEEVTVLEVGGTSNLQLPNVITPNGDGINDVFNVFIRNEDDLPDLTFTTFEIFNRWGQKVYDNDTPEIGWDGRFNGEYAPQDVYLYNIEVRSRNCPNSEPLIFKGDVTILR